MTAWNVATVVVSLVLIGGFLAIPGHATSARATDGACNPGGDSIYVAATGDYGYTPDTFSCLPTNVTITVTFVDNSTMAEVHTFTILGDQGVQVPNTDTQAQIDALAWGHSPQAFLNLNVSPDYGRNVSAFQSPGPGWYEFVCTTPSHFQEGMYGFIAFGMNLPTNLTLPSRTGVGGNLTFSPIDAAVIGAVVLALVLGYVVTSRRRSRRETRPSSVKAAPNAPTGLREIEEGREKRGP